jgi:hypothetical protein
MGEGRLIKRHWIDAYLLFVGLISTFYGYQAARLRSGWAIGEWLINYSGGFVRRGLLGELILLLGRLTHVGLPWLVLLAQSASYWILLWYVHRLASGVRWGLGMTVVLLSPATLAFVVLDPPSGFKKEVLLFAVLAWLIFLLQGKRAKLPDWQLSALLIGVLVPLVLSHEPLTFYFPYLFAALSVFHGGWRRAARLMAVPALVCGGAAFAAATHPGSVRTAQSICNSVGGVMPDMHSSYKVGLCDGGISSLTLTLRQSHQLTLEGDVAYHAIPIYAVLLVPSLLPMIMVLASYYRRGLRAEVVTIAVCAVSAGGLSLVLFYGATDYGRWIHMHAMCLMLLCIGLHQSSSVSEQQMDSAKLFTGVAKPWRPAAAVGLVLWVTCWNLPATLLYPARTGYLGLFHYVQGYSAGHRR